MVSSMLSGVLAGNTSLKWDHAVKKFENPSLISVSCIFSEKMFRKKTLVPVAAKLFYSLEIKSI